MPEWFNTPVIILAILAIGHLIWNVSEWEQKTDQVRRGMPSAIKRIQKDIRGLRKDISELREQVQRLLDRLPPRLVPPEGTVEEKLRVFFRPTKIVRPAGIQ